MKVVDVIYICHKCRKETKLPQEHIKPKCNNCKITLTNKNAQGWTYYSITPKELKWRRTS